MARSMTNFTFHPLLNTSKKDARRNSTIRGLFHVFVHRLISWLPLTVPQIYILFSLLLNSFTCLFFRWHSFENMSATCENVWKLLFSMQTAWDTHNTQIHTHRYTQHTHSYPHIHTTHTYIPIDTHNTHIHTHRYTQYTYSYPNIHTTHTYIPIDTKSFITIMQKFFVAVPKSVFSINWLFIRWSHLSGSSVKLSKSSPISMADIKHVHMQRTRTTTVWSFRR
jgi:hypothetical protein